MLKFSSITLLETGAAGYNQGGISPLDIQLGMRFYRSVVSILMVLIILALQASLFSAHASPDLENLHKKSQDALDARDWSEVVRLSEKGLNNIDSLIESDWHYSKEGSVDRALFWGSWIGVVEFSNISEKMKRLTVIDPGNNNIVGVYDPAPWNIDWIGQVDENPENHYIIAVESQPEYVGARVAIFDTTQVQPVRYYHREGADEFSLWPFMDGDLTKAWLLERQQTGIYLRLADIESGTVVTVSSLDFSLGVIPYKFGGIERYFRYLGKTGDKWLLAQGSKIYNINLQNGDLTLYNSLPFQVNEKSRFLKKHFTSVQDDVIHVVNLKKPDLKCRSYTFDNALNMDYKRWFGINEEGFQYLSCVGMDSTRMFRLEKDHVDQVLSMETLDGWGAWWNGNFIEQGPKGLRIVEEGNVLFSIEDQDVRAVIHDSLDVLWVHIYPNWLKLFKKNKRGDYKLVKAMDVHAARDRYLVYTDGFVILSADQHRFHVFDAKGQYEIGKLESPDYLRGNYREKVKSYVTYTRNEARTYRIFKGMSLRSEFHALASMSYWELGDTLNAVQHARRSIATTQSLTPRSIEKLVALFDKMEFEKEKLQMIGKSAIEIPDDRWRKKLLMTDVIALSEDAHLGKSYHLWVGDQTLLARSSYGYIPDVLLGRNNDSYIYDAPYNKAHVLNNTIIPNCSIDLDKCLLFFNSHFDSTEHLLEIEPVLYTEDGDIIELGNLFKRKAELGKLSSANIVTWGYEDRLEMEECADNYIVTCFRRLVLDEKVPTGMITVGVDLSGDGNHWVDTTLTQSITVGDRVYAHNKWGQLVSGISQPSRAYDEGIQEGDIIIGWGDYNIADGLNLGDIKRLYPPNVPLEMTYIRNEDTLSTNIENGRIGILVNDTNNMWEIEPKTGKRISEHPLPKGYVPRTSNSSGDLVYVRGDTIMLYDPDNRRHKKFIVPGSKTAWHWNQTNRSDVMVLNDHLDLVGVDLASTANDSDRLLWKQELSRNFEWVNNDDPNTLAALLNSGVLMILDVRNGSILSREPLPFAGIENPKIRKGNFYGIASGRLFVWKIEYYHPPFPWQNIGYAAMGLPIILLIIMPVYRGHIRKLKRKQAEELTKAEMEAELETAASIQRLIVPKPEDLPRIDGFEVYGYNYPCKEIGGDYFDIIPCGNGRIGMVMCDVSGKGLSAALLVSNLQATFHSLFNTELPLVEIAARANKILFSNTLPEQFASGFIGLLNIREGVLETVNAGHNAPMLVRITGDMEKLDKGGICFGMFDDTRYESQSVKMMAEDILYLYTDGVNEAFTPAGTEFDEKRLEPLVRSLAGLDAKNFLIKVETVVSEWTQTDCPENGFEHDDFTQMALKRLTNSH